VPAIYNEKGFQLRTIGLGHRLDGLADLLVRADGASVLDIGSNRGRVAYEFERYGATVIHGCDIYETGMMVANEWFADLRGVRSRFEVVDLIGGGAAIEAKFGATLLKQYDFILYLAVHHKLSRIMDKAALLQLVGWLADHCEKYFVWRGSEIEAHDLSSVLVKKKGFKLVHWSLLSEIVFDGKLTPQPCGVWKRAD